MNHKFIIVVKTPVFLENKQTKSKKLRDKSPNETILGLYDDMSNLSYLLWPIYAEFRRLICLNPYNH